VIVVDPDAAVVARTVHDLGDAVEGLCASLSGPHGSRATVERCIARWGDAVDIVVSCGAAMETWPERHDDIERLVEVVLGNVRGPYEFVSALRPLLVASPSASVVLLGSIDGVFGNPRVPGYSMGKGALVTLTHLLAADFGADGIRVNCVAAAGIAQTGSDVTPLDRVTGDPDLALRLTPLGRWPSAEEIAAVVRFFAGDDASYVTGAVLPVDGGRSAATPGTY
jgi:NAD(P)-dependent dehydrogenase (short-subunit alcohol dehydrogenase family)